MNPPKDTTSNASALPPNNRMQRTRGDKVIRLANKLAHRNRPRKMRAYATFEDYLANQSSRNQTIIRALRMFVRRVEPGLSEAVKWGNGCWIGASGPVAYVYSDTQYVQFGFFRGSSLKDPKGLLEGKGQYVRHIKVHAPAEIDQRAFAALLGQAAGSRKRRQASPSRKARKPRR